MSPDHIFQFMEAEAEVLSDGQVAVRFRWSIEDELEFKLTPIAADELRRQLECEVQKAFGLLAAVNASAARRNVLGDGS